MIILRLKKFRQRKVSDKLVPDKLGIHGHVTTGAGRDFPQFPTVYIHSTATDRQVNHNSHLSQSLYASCTREYATEVLSRALNDRYIAGHQS